MTNDLFPLFLEALLEAIPAVLGAFVQAFQAQPWPWIAIASVMLIGAFVPTRKRSRRAY
jgi:hypothetical protein